MHWSVKLSLSFILIAIIYFVFPLLPFLAVYGTMSIQNEIAYNKSFHTNYKEKEYHDPRINFYKKELEKSYEGYVRAKDIVSRFEYDSKVNLAHKCIDYYIEDYNSTEWRSESSGIRINARNKAANTDKLIKSAKDNAHEIQLNFYLYDFNLVYNIMDDIIGSQYNKSKKSLCDQNLSVEKLYDTFLTNYLSEYINNYASSKYRKQSPSDNQEFLEHMHTREESWLREITKSSSIKQYKEFSMGNIGVRTLYDKYDYRSNTKPFDVAIDGQNFFVADPLRGIELWKQNSDGKISYHKTLEKGYQAYSINKIGEFIYVLGTDKKNGKHYFFIFSYNSINEDIVSFDKIEINVKIESKWSFINNNKKVILTKGYSGMTILDISDPTNIKVDDEVLDASKNINCIDFVINEERNILYILTSRGLYIYNIKNNLLDFVTNITSFKKHRAMVFSKDENALYSVSLDFKKGVFIHKYSLDDSYKPELISIKRIESELKGWKQMKTHGDKIYLADKKNLYVFNVEMENIKKMNISGINHFYFSKDKFVCACGEEGLLINTLN